ncbi:MAG: hypothetical protein OEZ40_07465, partial [Candidatus Bathyarchaeota archaeon]|nr:hypothetical protein [Candidatus Bathyarchaeota archaeon]
SNNGVLCFDNRLNETQQLPVPDAFYGNEIPSTEGLNAFIAPFWRELNPHLGGRVLYVDHIYIQPPGEYDPNRHCAVISWIDVPDKFGNPQTFQVIIELSRPQGYAYRQNLIWFQYKNVTFDQETIVGIEDHGGWDGFSIDPQIPQAIQGNKAIKIGQVYGCNSFLVSAITIKLSSQDSGSDSYIVPYSGWIRGYNVELNSTLPDDELRYALAFGNVLSLGLDAFGMLVGGLFGAIVSGGAFS